MEINMKKIVLVVSTAKHFKTFVVGLAEKHKILKYDITRYRVSTEDKDYQLVTRPDQLRGYHGVEIEFYDPEHNLADFNELYELAQIARMP